VRRGLSTSRPDGLRLYCYSSSCVYGGQWNDATLIARGLVLDVDKQAVVATPFPKFFNAFERGESIPLSAESRQVIFRLVRPTANELPGYVPSYAINRLQDDPT
jgi:hypothetical protein